MENNKTAVQWLEQEFEKYLGWSIEGDYKASEYTATDFSNALEQAKEMEKEQIIDAFNASRGTVHGELYYTSAKSYYIEKFKEEE